MDCPEDGGYPKGNLHLLDDPLPDGGSYSPVNNYPEKDAYEDSKAQENDYPQNSEGSNYPKEGAPVAPLSYRYDSQGYADDEEQYDNSNPSRNRPQESEMVDEPRPEDDDLHVSLTDSLDYGQRAGVPHDNNEPTDSLDYGKPLDTNRNNDPQEPEPPDSLEFGYSQPSPEQTYPSDNYADKYGETYDEGDQASYGSLDEEEPRNVPNKTKPRNIEDHANKPQEKFPVVQQPPPPNGKRKPSAGSRSQGQGSRGSDHHGYSNIEGKRGSANQKGSAGSDKSDRSRPQQNPHQQVASSSLSSGNPNHDKFQGNRTKVSPIPAIELSAKELLKRTRSKDTEDIAERLKFEHSNSQIIKKNGEEFHISYISDDSGDEGEHFLDEKGSPVDHFGKPLYKDLHGTSKKPEEPKLEFRIKPTPPKQKSPLELQSVNARRTSADAAGGHNSPKKIPIGGKITIAKPFPTEEPTIEKAQGVKTGLLDGALPPRQVSPPEADIQKSYVQQEGIDTSTLPPQLQDGSTRKDHMESPSSSASKSRTPFGRGSTRQGSGTNKEDNYKDLRFESKAAAEDGRENKAAVEEAINKDLEETKSTQPRTSTREIPRSGKPFSGTYNKADFGRRDAYPPISRGPSGASYTERGIQYTPQEGQRREPEYPALPQPQAMHAPMVQHPYNAQHERYMYLSQQEYEYDNQQQHYYPSPTDPNYQSGFRQPPGFPSGPQQHNPDGYPLQPNWDPQQQHGPPWSSGHPPQVPRPFYNTGQPQYEPQYGVHNPQEGYFNQPQPGYDGPIGRPNLPHSDQGQYHVQQQPYSESYPNYQGVPPQGRPAGPPQGYMSPSHGSAPPLNRVYPNQGMQPASGFYPSQDQPLQNEPPQPRQRPLPKTKPNFIDINKANLIRGPPRKRYAEMQKKVITPTRVNPRKPLPDISQESAHHDDPWAEESYNQGSARTWAHDDWTHQLIQQQQNMPLRRGHSDGNLYNQTQNYGAGPVHQGYQPQGVPITSNMPYSDGVGTGHSQDPRANQPAYNQTYPPQMPRNQNGLPYSYSADHATHYTRNNGQPQLSGPPRARVAFADDTHNSLDSDVNPMTFANEGVSTGYQHATKRTSPYTVLPGIPGQNKTGKE